MPIYYPFPYSILIKYEDRLFLSQMRQPSGIGHPWIENHNGDLYQLSTESKALFDLWCSTLESMRYWFEIRST